MESEPGYNWMDDHIVVNPETVRILNLSGLSKSEDEIIDLASNVMPYVSIGSKIYSKYEDKGPINYRKFLCPLMTNSNELENELDQLQEELKSNTDVHSSVKTMSRKRIVKEWYEKNSRQKMSFRTIPFCPLHGYAKFFSRMLHLIRDKN